MPTPTLPLTGRILVYDCNNLGVLQLRPPWVTRDAARKEYEAARGLRCSADDFPAVPRHQVDLGGSYGNFGALVLGEVEAGRQPALVRPGDPY